MVHRVTHVFAKVLFIFVYFMKSKESVDLELLLQQILLKRLDEWFENLLVVGLWNLRTSVDNSTLVKPKSWNATQVDQTHVQKTETEVAPQHFRSF